MNLPSTSLWLLADIPPDGIGESEFVGLGIVGVFLLIGLGAFVLWLMMLIHAIKNPKLSSDMRLIWVLVIVLAGPIGAVVYAAAGRQGDVKGRYEYEQDDLE